MTGNISNTGHPFHSHFGASGTVKSFINRPACQPSRLSEEPACPTELQMSDDKNAAEPTSARKVCQGKPVERQKKKKLKTKQKKDVNSFYHLHHRAALIEIVND